MLVFGTRPEAIKMAPVYAALRALPETFETVCCVTGQHREMLDQVLDTFSIVPDIDLDLMRERQDLTDITSAVLVGMRRALREVRPALVLVHGDTTTSMASALAAFYEGISVGHVEAGLRSHDIGTPFPEEFNRRVTGLVAAYHFAPTAENKAHLLAEGRDPDAIVVTGNTVADALNDITARIDSDRPLRARIEDRLDLDLGFAWREKRFVVVTCHRRETLSAGLDDVCASLSDLAAAFPGTHFVVSVHRNPNVAVPIRTQLGGRSNIHLVSPLRYDAFAHLLRHCHCVLTDSGGLQEEGPILGKPVLVMRKVTERPEALASGAVRLVGVDRAAIVAEVSRMLTDTVMYDSMARAPNPFGDGTAGRTIAAFLEREMQGQVAGGGKEEAQPFSPPSPRGRARSEKRIQDSR